MQEKPKHKELFWGGVLRGPKSLYAEILRVFNLRLIKIDGDSANLVVGVKT